MINLPNARVAVLDDEQYICDIIVESLAGENYDLHAFSDPRQGLEFVKSNPVDLVLTDLMMSGYSGVEVLETALACHGDAIVILMTAHPTVETAISVLRKGAYDFLVKPFKMELLKATVRRGLAHQRVLRENLRLKGQVEFLKAATGITTGVEIDKYLQLVLNSCKTEMGAVAAAIIEIDPRTRTVIRELHDTLNDDHERLVLDTSPLEKFSGRTVVDAVVTTERIDLSDGPMVRTHVSSPIYIRKTLHGVINLLLLERFHRLNPGQMDILAILTNAAGSAIANNILYQDLEKSYLQAIRALANAIEARDRYTAGHTDRVIKLATPVARYMGWTDGQINHLIVGCTLHDIGKIGVPDSILNKPGHLTSEERATMTNHPAVGVHIVQDIELFRPALPYILAHHERYDGKGYPRGLAGEEIPIEGRLLAVADTFDAILSDRPYRKGASLVTAASELYQNRGSQFDPQIVRTFFEVIRQGKIDLVELYGREENLTCLDPYLAAETVRA